MRRWALLIALGLPLAATMDAGAQQRQAPPHEWVFGAWTGGIFPPGEIEGAACFANPTVIFTRDVVMRASVLDVAYRQRTIETAASVPNGLEFRFTPVVPTVGAFGGQVPPDVGFGCGDSPNVLRVERRGPDEIVFPNCSQFPSPLRRCKTQ